jgi:hypothetical protein
MEIETIINSPLGITPCNQVGAGARFRWPGEAADAWLRHVKSRTKRITGSVQEGGRAGKFAPGYDQTGLNAKPGEATY